MAARTLPDILKQTVKQSKALLCERLKVDEHFLSLLESVEVLTVEQVDAVKAGDTDYIQNAQLVEFLMRKPAECYVQFLHCLLESDQHQLVTHLMGNSGEEGPTVQPEGACAPAIVWCRRDKEILRCCTIGEPFLSFLEEKGIFSLQFIKNLSETERSSFYKECLLRNTELSFMQLTELDKQLRCYDSADMKSINIREKEPMTEEHKAVLIRNRNKLVSCMEPDIVIEELVSCSVLSYMELEDIKAFPARYRRVIELMTILLRKADLAYYIFLEALHSSDQGQLANMIRQNEGCDDTVGSDYGVAIKFKLNRNEAESEMHEMNVRDMERLKALKQELYNQLLTCQVSEEIKIVREKLSALETPERSITEVYRSSIFVGLKCGDEAGEKDLVQKYETGELKNIVLEAFGIKQLREKYGLQSLNVVVKLHKIENYDEFYEHEIQHRDGAKSLKRANKGTLLSAEDDAFITACLSGDLDSLTDISLVLEKSRVLTSGIHAAVRNGHIRVLTLLLSKGAPLHVADDAGKTSLHLASLHRQEQIAAFLVENGADVNVQEETGKSPLALAVKSGDLQMVDQLLMFNSSPDISDNHGNTPLHIACSVPEREELPAVPGTSCAAAEEEKAVADEPSLKRGKYTLSEESGISYDIMESLLRANAIIINSRNDSAKTPLLVVIEHGSLLHVITLLEHGADPSVADNRGWLPIHAAAHRGRADMLEALLGPALYYRASVYKGTSPPPSYKPAVNVQENTGKTPLMLAAGSGSVESVNLLIQRRAEVELEDSGEMRALHYGCQGNHQEVIKTLLNAGALTEVYTKDSKLPISLATSRECQKLIIKHEKTKPQIQRPQFDPDDLCDICTEHLTEPRVLECGHVFCVTCLEKLVKDDVITCPKCRTETALLPDLGVKYLPQKATRSPAKFTTHTSSMLTLVKTWQVETLVSSLVTNDRNALIYVGQKDKKIPVYTFTGKLVNQLTGGMELPYSCLDTKRDLLLSVEMTDIKLFTHEGELVSTITCPEIKVLEDICYQVCEDRYVVADRESHCLHFICADTGNVLRSVHAEEARLTSLGNRNVYMAASRFSHSSGLVTADVDNNLVKLYDGEGNLIRSYTGVESETGRFNTPGGVCFDHQDRILVFDVVKHSLIRISPDTEDDTRSCEVIMDTSSLGLGHPRYVDVTEDGLVVISLFTDPNKGPFNVGVFSGYHQSSIRAL